MDVAGSVKEYMGGGRESESTGRSANRRIISKTDGSENPGEWRVFEQEDWRAKKDKEALDRLTANETPKENSSKDS